jgi:hypothetical protein
MASYQALRDAFFILVYAHHHHLCRCLRHLLSLSVCLFVLLAAVESLGNALFPSPPPPPPLLLLPRHSGGGYNGGSMKGLLEHCCSAATFNAVCLFFFFCGSNSYKLGFFSLLLFFQSPHCLYFNFLFRPLSLFFVAVYFLP